MIRIAHHWQEATGPESETKELAQSWGMWRRMATALMKGGLLFDEAQREAANIGTAVFDQLACCEIDAADV